MADGSNGLKSERTAGVNKENGERIKKKKKKNNKGNLVVPPLDRFAQHSLAQEALGPSTATSQSTKAGVERRLKTGLRFTFLQGENCLHPAILVLGSRARIKKKTRSDRRP